MKKRVQMTCVLKSGVVVRDAFRMIPEEIQILNKLKKCLEDATLEGAAKFTFGHTTIAVSEIAAITFK